MRKPEITVLMPVFNAADHLEEAVGSILRQTFDDFELLIIDDGSTDVSPTLILSSNDPRIRLVRMEVNGGIVKALNHGLSLAYGKFIARMDADDIAEPNRLERQYAYMNQNPSIGLCGTDFHPFGGAMRASWIKYTDPNDIKIALLFENPICHPTVMMRRDAVEAVSYPSNYPHAEEYALWVALAREVNLVNLQDHLLRYREHKGQISKTKSEQQCASIDRLITSQLQALGITPTSHELRLHKTLGGAFYPVPRLGKALCSWINRLEDANRSLNLYSHSEFHNQLEKRLEETLNRTNAMLSSFSLANKLQWKIRSWMSSLS